MGFYTGRNGSVGFNGKKVAKIQNWSLDTSVELLSTNSIDSVVNTFTPGIKGATGSGTLIYYRLEPGENAVFTQFTEVIGRIIKTGAVLDSDRVLLDLNVGGDAADNFKLYAFITQAQIGVSRGELTTVPFQFTMDGDFLEVIS
jgi:hypothetical protein